MYWIIAYDISSGRRRNRVARRLEQAGLRVQKSVFLVELSPSRVGELLRQLAALIDHQTDQVAAWPLGHQMPEKRLQATPGHRPILQQTVVW